MLKSILKLQFRLLKYFGLKRRYSILFGLTVNFLKIIQEYISLMHDSITEKTEVSTDIKDKYIWVSSA